MLRTYAELSHGVVPEASDALLHYLDGTGADFNVDVDSIVRIPQDDDVLEFSSSTSLADFNYLYSSSDNFSDIETMYYFVHFEEVINHAVSVLNDGYTISVILS